MGRFAAWHGKSEKACPGESTVGIASGPLLRRLFRFRCSGSIHQDNETVALTVWDL